jgi:hypothetical protein
MKEQVIYKQAISLTILIAILLASGIALAQPPEGLEAFGIASQGQSNAKSTGKGGATNKLIYALGGYTHTGFVGDYQYLAAYASQPLLGNNYLTYGGKLTTGNSLGDRDAYFLRYDETFFNQSVSLKLLHIDYRYITAAKNVLSLDFNSAFHIGRNSLFYFVGGLYYRTIAYSWNKQTWNPTNFGLDDTEYFPEFLLGSKLEFGDSAFVTFDLSNREVFDSLNGDNVTFDITLNLGSVKSFVWRLISSTKYTGILGGNGDIGEQTFSLGFITSL